MINFDVVHEPRRARHHFLLPNCHYMLIGPTGCWKTNKLFNMLLQWMCPDRVAIYTINPDREKYQMPTNFFDTIKEESGEEILEVCNPEDVIPVEELDKKDEDGSKIQQVIAFYDIKIDKKNMDRIKEYFSLSRNKNCCCISVRTTTMFQSTSGATPNASVCSHP